jgi:hypothetical protein
MVGVVDDACTRDLGTFFWLMIDVLDDVQDK